MSTAPPTITILVDNAAVGSLAAVHGFSLWIEADGRRVLFDTGPDDTIAVNARALGIDLASADAIVLSHGHADHCGGLGRVLRLAGSVDVYCHPAAVLPHYAVRGDITKPLRMGRESMSALDRLPQERIHWLQEPTWLTTAIGLTGPIPRSNGFEHSGGPFFLDPGGRRPDPLDDDLALWISTAEGLIVCVGCAHAGLINTMEHVCRLNRGLPIRAVIGGFHLSGADPARLAQTVSSLRRFTPDLVVPCHCTGETAVDLLRQTLGDRVRTGWAGMRCLEPLADLTTSPDPTTPAKSTANGTGA